MAPGEVAEWSNAPHSKCGIGASLSGVRIPPSPPVSHIKRLIFLVFLCLSGIYVQSAAQIATIVLGAAVLVFLIGCCAAVAIVARIMSFGDPGGIE
jgi:hypothetical protein